MRLADFDLNLLLAFEALVAERSVTLAARRLGVGQPAASAALARLRGLLNDPLFLRGPEGMRPTPRALEVAPGIAAALAELRRTLEPVARFDPAVATRCFALASTDYTSLVLLPAVAAEIGRAAPGVDLQVVGYAKDDVPALLARGALDMPRSACSPNRPARRWRRRCLPRPSSASRGRAIRRWWMARWRCRPIAGPPMCW
jgi:DNA-binding transcriptional LysR family regulator